MVETRRDKPSSVSKPSCISVRSFQLIRVVQNQCNLRLGGIFRGVECDVNGQVERTLESLFRQLILSSSFLKKQAWRCAAVESAGSYVEPSYCWGGCEV